MSSTLVIRTPRSRSAGAATVLAIAAVVAVAAIVLVLALSSSSGGDHALPATGGIAPSPSPQYVPRTPAQLRVAAGKPASDTTGSSAPQYVPRTPAQLRVAPGSSTSGVAR